VPNGAGPPAARRPHINLQAGRPGPPVSRPSGRASLMQLQPRRELFVVRERSAASFRIDRWIRQLAAPVRPGIPA